MNPGSFGASVSPSRSRAPTTSKPAAWQGLRDQAGVVGRGRERRLGVSAVADDQRNPLFLLLRGGGTQDPRESAEQDQARRKNRKTFLSHRMAALPAHGSTTTSAHRAHDQLEHHLNETRCQSNKALRTTRKRRTRPIGSRLKKNKLDGILLMPRRTL